MSGFGLATRHPLWILALAAAPAFAQDDSGTAPETIDCEGGLSGNARSDEVECVGLRIDDGTHVVTAGRALTNRYDLEGSAWQLDQGVSLSFGGTEIQAESARFEFEAGELVFAELKGNPVRMSDFIGETGKSVTGTAETIVYDERTSMLSLNGQATLVVGANEKSLSGCAWSYNLDDKSFNAGSSEDCAGVQLRVAQPEDDESPEGQSEPP